MSSQASTADFDVVDVQSARLRIAEFLSKGIFGALLSLIAFTAVPFGTVEPWWKAFFICAIFMIAIVAIIEWLLSGDNTVGNVTVLLPMIGLVIFALLQAIRFARGNPELLSVPSRSAISADPYSTWFFVMQLAALTLALSLLYRYAATSNRIRVLIYSIIGVAVASAIFGIIRQTTQHDIGFVLPRIKPGQGYGQFINKNHFAFLMEMAFGLGLGLILAGGISRERVMILLALLLPIWTGLVLSNSRGGILSMLAQLVLAALLTVRVNSRNQPRLVKLAESAVLQVALIAALVLGILIGTLWVGGDRLASTFGAVSDEFSVDSDGLRQGVTRNEIWRTTWKLFKAHPILGVGLGGYWVAVTEYHDASGTMTPQEAHNEYLEVLASGGIVGFGMLIWFIVSVIKSARRNLRSTDSFVRSVCFAAVIGIFGVSVHSLFDFGLHLMANAVVFVSLIMMATVTMRLKEARS